MDLLLNGIFFLNDTRISELSYEIPSINVDKASFEAVFGLNPDDLHVVIIGFSKCLSQSFFKFVQPKIR